MFKHLKTVYIMNTLKSKILNYEQDIFNEYISKRKKFIKNIKKQNNFNDKQLLNFINDIKAVIDPIKISISSMEDYFSNVNFDKSTKFKIEEMLFIYLFLEERLSGLSSLETLETLDSDTELKLKSDSESESDSSKISEPRSSKSLSFIVSNK